MSKVTRSITVEQQIWKKAMEKAGHGNLSDEIEKLLQEYADVKDREMVEDIDILERSNLSKGQKETVRTMLREKKAQINIQQFGSLVKENGIYGRRDFIKKAIQNISKDERSLYEKKGDELLVQQIKCGCGSKVSPIALEGKCRNCGRQLVDLKKEDEDFEVV